MNATLINPKKTINFEELLNCLHKEHHHSLELCWKIREGIKRNIAPNRIKNYADWFYTNHLELHFQIENEQLFSILGTENELVKKVLAKQRRIKKHFAKKIQAEKSLNRIEEDLEELIRFEEKNIFTTIRNNIPKNTTPSIIEFPFLELNKEWDDIFWQ